MFGSRPAAPDSPAPAAGTAADLVERLAPRLAAATCARDVAEILHDELRSAPGVREAAIGDVLREGAPRSHALAGAGALLDDLPRAAPADLLEVRIDENVACVALEHCAATTLVAALRLDDAAKPPAGLLAAASLASAHLARIAAEQRLDDARNRFDVLVRSVPGVVYLCANDARYTMHFVSESVVALTGRPATDFLDDRVSFVELYHPEDEPRIGPRVDAALAARQPFVLRYRLRHTDGSWRWVEEHGQGVFDADQELRFLEGTLLDVTERVHAEEERERLHLQLLQAQKLESLGQLAAGIAHDFNNLLTGILGMSSLALADLPENHPARGPVAHVVEAAERASKLTVQLQAYGGQVKLERAPLELSPEVRQIAELVRSSLPAGAELILNLGAGLPPIEADAGQLQQVILNLILNAGEALEGRSGRVIVSTGERRLSEAELDLLQPAQERGPGTYVYLQVDDEGCGISDETLARIFDPFFSTKRPGRGLGLAAVLGIVGSHAGGIQVESRSGRGTRFVVYLPAATDPASREPTDTVGELAGGGTVLVVDDERLVRQLATAVLVRHGYRVLAAETGPDALELFRERGNEIDVVVLDLNMPGMDGAETLGELRRIDPDVRVVLSSGFTEQHLVDRLDAERPVQGMLEKPYTSARLAAAVHGARFSG